MSETASSPRRALLIVEDESIVAHDLKQLLTSFHYDAYAIAASADEALARAAERRPDLALVDVRLKGRTDGIRTSQLLRERYGTPIIYLTAHAEPATLERAKLTQPYGYLVKPVNPAALRSSIEIALYRHDMETEERRRTAAPQPAEAPQPAARPGRAPSARAVRRQIETLFSNPDFDAPRRSREFLRFIVEETLAGRGEELTQAAIATQAFGRKDDFDAMVDPIVRIQAGRLRRSLERYYLLSGKQDPLRIELPRGSYVPTFHAHAEETASAEPLPAPAPAALEAQAEDWPAVSIHPFSAAPGDPELEAAAARVKEELFLELGRYRSVRTLRQAEPGEASNGLQERARFSLRGAVRRERGSLRVSAHLVDRTRADQVWGDTYDTAPDPQRWSGSPEDIARVIAARVGAEEGVVVQLLSSECKRTPATPGAYTAMLLSYEFFLARDPAMLSAAIDALQTVVRADPNCGPAWTRLGRLFVVNHCLEITSLATPLGQALTYAHQGARADASSRTARCILALVLLSMGELQAARAELDEALRLSPDSLVYLESIGYLLMLAGDWERGAALGRSARHRNPHCESHVQFGFWADHLRRGEIEAAYQAALEYRDPAFFWRSLMLASCLGHLGRNATVELAELLRSKPDIETRGRTLIGHFIKFPEVMDRIVEGLGKAGLRLA